MAGKFEVGDHVSWNSEAGRVSGTIVRIHTRDFEVHGYAHHASAEAPQYEIKNSKTKGHGNMVYLPGSGPLQVK